MRIKYSRVGPAFVLGGACAIGLSILVVDTWGRVAAESGDTEVRLARLQRAAAESGADVETWLPYARALQAAGRWDHAAQAWRRVAQLDPFSVEAMEGLAAALAARDDRDGLFEHLDTLVLFDARLALRVLTRPGIARYSGDSRYAGLLAEARSQAID